MRSWRACPYMICSVLAYKCCAYTSITGVIYALHGVLKVENMLQQFLQSLAILPQLYKAYIYSCHILCLIKTYLCKILSYSCNIFSTIIFFFMHQLIKSVLLAKICKRAYLYCIIQSQSSNRYWISPN